MEQSGVVQQGRIMFDHGDPVASLVQIGKRPVSPATELQRPAVLIDQPFAVLGWQTKNQRRIS